MDAVTAIVGLGGAATAAQLVDACGRRALQRAVADGTVVRVARGRYVRVGADPATVALQRSRGVLAGLSAAESFGWGLLHRPTAMEIAVPYGQQVPRQPGVVHRRRALTSAERAAGRTEPARTVLDCACTQPFVDALAVADSALRSGLARPEDLRHLAAQPLGPGARRARRVVAAADGRAANAFESGLRGHLLQAGIRGFVPQHVVTAPGFFAVVDLADPERKVALEADGHGVHGDRRRFAKDLRRHDELTALGWVTLRFAWEHVMFEADWVVGQVRAVLRGRRRTEVLQPARLPRRESA